MPTIPELGWISKMLDNTILSIWLFDASSVVDVPWWACDTKVLYLYPLPYFHAHVPTTVLFVPDLLIFSCQKLDLTARSFSTSYKHTYILNSSNFSFHRVDNQAAILQFLHIRKVFPYIVFKGHFWMKLHFSYYLFLDYFLIPSLLIY